MLDKEESEIITNKILNFLNSTGKVVINIEKSENGRVFIRSNHEECLLKSKK